MHEENNRSKQTKLQSKNNRILTGLHEQIKIQLGKT